MRLIFISWPLFAKLLQILKHASNYVDKIYILFNNLDEQNI